MKAAAFKEDYIAIILRELLKGLEYLHCEGKLHRGKCFFPPPPPLCTPLLLHPLLVAPSWLHVLCLVAPELTKVIQLHESDLVLYPTSTSACACDLSFHA
jgi:hypothetical protein